MSLCGPLCDVVARLEDTFEPGMTWKNPKRWTVDHIRPICGFDLSKEEDRVQAFHWTNIQAMWPADNQAKGSSEGHRGCRGAGTLPSACEMSRAPASAGGL